MTRLAKTLVATTLILASCGIEAGNVRTGPAPLCDTSSRGMLILMAQAVPSADLIPCLNTLPAGWVVERAEIETGSAEISIDGGSVGDVILELEPSCDPAGESVGSGPTPGVDAFEALADDEVVRYFVFAGGCVKVIAPNRLAAGEMTSEIGFLTRDELRQASGLEL